MRDILDRPLRDLRLSVTDRCNFRCSYCMPLGPRYVFSPREALLTFEELTALVRIFVDFGVRKLRITGGEPLLRRDLPLLIDMLAAVEGVADIALTTNGYFLPKWAEALRTAGLDRVTVSLDSLNAETMANLTGRGVTPDAVLSGVDAALAADLGVKLNTVLQRGVNDDEVEALAQMARERGVTLRFIEFMDVGNLNRWDLSKVVPVSEVVTRIGARFPHEPVDAAYRGEVARRYRYLDGCGEFGVIASVTQPFCGDCTRARLSAEGELFTCLFATKGRDLKQLLRSQGEDAVREALAVTWSSRRDRYSEERDPTQAQQKVEMYHIGG